jgi:hypothetical protein
MHSISRNEFRQYIQSFDFSMLFNSLGWNYRSEAHPVNIGTESFCLNTVAEKSGFRILVCSPAKNGDIPEYSMRLKIDRAVARLFKEHLIIFTNENKAQQLWQVMVKEPGHPSRVTEMRWYKEQDPELLFQKASSLLFTIDEEEGITIVDVTEKVNDILRQNSEKATAKKFYNGLKKQHASFKTFIQGISEIGDIEWYATVMFNRLMFCYFMQKKGFLDNNRNYLKEKLKACQEKKGENKFYSFYRDFLRMLFHEGLGDPEHSEALKNEIGRVPYLNGGMFDVHELEKKNENINIPDKAFESLFNFFDTFTWHIDTRKQASGREINPDIIGHIFEKYINERAKMGAYYTQEDITEYISKNSILPFLFQETQRKYPDAFHAEGEIWALLKKSSGNYIYDSLKHGSDAELPAEIADGIKNFDKRTDWNKTAPSSVGLPGETWREVIERRARHVEVKEKIDKGEIQNISDFITLNLNIRRFLQDILEESTNPELIRHFYDSLMEVSVIDPTCGSGAFLFAAMNILEPLYETCLMRMRAFVEDEDQLNSRDKQSFSNRYVGFRKILTDIQNEFHPNLQYFIYKSIMLKNLYGVDIMKEAMEITKFRLFLKLASTVDADYSKPNIGIEPLPDIDFNIRPGNALIGFSDQSEMEAQLGGDVDTHKELEPILEECEVLGQVYKRFKDIQLATGENFISFKSSKDIVYGRLKNLNAQMNLALSKQHGVDPDTLVETGKGEAKKLITELESWLNDYQPFHWFGEFYGVLAKGGFDVIIGNPPYVEYKEVNYKVRDYSTISCSNLYAFVCERSSRIMQQRGYCGMIIPMSGHSTDRMESLVMRFYRRFRGGYIMNISADAHPSVLFEGVKFRLAVFLLSNQFNGLFVTRYYRWYAEERENLFQLVKYNTNGGFKYKSVIPKIAGAEHLSVLKKMNAKRDSLGSESGSYCVYYHNTPVHWIRAHKFIPYFSSERDGEKISSQLKAICYPHKDQAGAAGAILCSSLFFIWWITVSDCYHLNKSEIFNFKVDFSDKDNIKKLSLLAEELEEDMKKKSVRRVYNYETSGKVEYDEFYMKKSKHIIDKIDTVLADMYGLTEEELDFIINYDIKYRLGSERREDTDED